MPESHSTDSRVLDGLIAPGIGGFSRGVPRGAAQIPTLRENCIRLLFAKSGIFRRGVYETIVRQRRVIIGKTTAKKQERGSEFEGGHPAGAKARPLFSGICGTTEVVPRYKPVLIPSFFRKL